MPKDRRLEYRLEIGSTSTGHRSVNLTETARGRTPHRNRTAPEIRASTKTRGVEAITSRSSGGGQTPVMLIRNRVRWMDRAVLAGPGTSPSCATNRIRTFKHRLLRCSVKGDEDAWSRDVVDARASRPPRIPRVELISIPCKSSSAGMVRSGHVDLAGSRPRSQSDLIALSIRSSQDGHMSGQS